MGTFARFNKAMTLSVVGAWAARAVAVGFGGAVDFTAVEPPAPPQPARARTVNAASMDRLMAGHDAVRDRRPALGGHGGGGASAQLKQHALVEPPPAGDRLAAGRNDQHSLAR